MKIGELLAQKKPVFSFEFFPPRSPRAEAQLMETLWDLSRLKPDFVSVTYGAGGSTQEHTLDLVSRIKNDQGIETVAHLTCVNAAKDETAQVIAKLKSAGIENILALRGDPPEGETEFVPHPDGFSYASEMIAFIKGLGDFSIGGACYPEGHVECRDLDRDMDHLKAKVDAGAEFLVTQIFFENTDYFAFVERARRKGITVPILPGIMPVTNLNQVKKFTDLCGATLPEELLARLEEVKGNPLKVPSVGVDWAIKQSQKLLDANAAGIHFYTLNHSSATRAVFQELRETN